MDGTDEEELKKLNQMVRAALAPVDENVQLTEDDLHDASLLADLESLSNPTSTATPPSSSKIASSSSAQPSFGNDPFLGNDSLDQSSEVEDEKTLKKKLEEEKNLLAFFKESGDREGARGSATEIARISKLLGMNSNKSNQSTQTSEGGQENLIPELEERKLNYKRAALAQKKAGDINSAKDLLKNAKIIESAIERIRMGQKIDPSSIPPPPGSSIKPAKTSNTSSSSSQPSSSSSSSSSSTKTTKKTTTEQPKRTQEEQKKILKKQLEAQFDFIEGEGVRSLSWLHKQAVECKERGEKKDAVLWWRKEKKLREQLEQVRIGRAAGAPLPDVSHQTEEIKREISFSHIHPDQLEVVIKNAQHLTPPSGYKDVSPYIVTTFSFPSDSPQTWTTSSSSGWNPRFKEKRVFSIQRNHRTFNRFVERKKIVFEIYHKRFLFSDVLMGKAEIALSPFLDQAEIEEEIPVIVNRKPTPGKLSICLRITTPLQKKHFRVEKEEILVIEKVYLKPIEVSQPPPQVVSPPPKDNISKENSSSKDSPSSNLSPQNTAPIEKDSSNLSNPNDSSSQETPSQEIPSQTSSQDTASKNSSPLPTDSTTTTTTTKEKEKIQQPPEPQNRNQEQNQNQGQNQNQKEKEKEKEKEEKKEKRGDEVTEEEIEKLESVQNLISDSVLEWSLNDTLRMIQERKRKKEETDDLEFRKSQIELKMNMLIVQIQTEQLTMEKYAAMLQEKIEEERNWAKKLALSGNRDAAKKAMHRAKLMENELTAEE